MNRCMGSDSTPMPGTDSRDRLGRGVATATTSRRSHPSSRRPPGRHAGVTTTCTVIRPGALRTGCASRDRGQRDGRRHGLDRLAVGTQRGGRGGHLPAVAGHLRAGPWRLLPRARRRRDPSPGIGRGRRPARPSRRHGACFSAKVARGDRGEEPRRAGTRGCFRLAAPDLLQPRRSSAGSAGERRSGRRGQELTREASRRQHESVLAIGEAQEVASEELTASSGALRSRRGARPHHVACAG